MLRPAWATHQDCRWQGELNRPHHPTRYPEDSGQGRPLTCSILFTPTLPISPLGLPSPAFATLVPSDSSSPVQASPPATTHGQPLHALSPGPTFQVANTAWRCKIQPASDCPLHGAAGSADWNLYLLPQNFGCEGRRNRRFGVMLNYRRLRLA